MDQVSYKSSFFHIIGSNLKFRSQNQNPIIFAENIPYKEAIINKGTRFAYKWPGYATSIHMPFLGYFKQ